MTLDLDHSGSGDPTIGDEIVSTAEFFIGSREDGKDGVVCTKVRLPERFQCVATNSFEKGDLMVQFLDASGAVTFVDDPAPARDEVTFRFITPR